MKLSYSRVILLIGIVIMIASQVLPFWTQTQKLTLSGPLVQFTETRNYWIDTRITPPIKSGSRMSVTLASSKPGSAAILIFPSTPDGDMRGPSLLAEALQPGVSSASWNLNAPQESNYMVVVTSWNSTYILTLESIWSPFYETRTALLVGFAVAFGGMLLEYYHKIVLAERKRLNQFPTGRKRIRGFA